MIYYLVIHKKYVGKLVAIAAVTIWNFWVNLKLSWRGIGTTKNCEL
ncbi:MAG: hypothetical protein KME08_10725 [Aphanothece sp. CMT-3BRIN-NPC111]|nr:hypothetical protein [Aphanothece sp. CMT-3BRIN-NPC111]